MPRILAVLAVAATALAGCGNSQPPAPREVAAGGVGQLGRVTCSQGLASSVTTDEPTLLPVSADVSYTGTVFAVLTL